MTRSNCTKPRIHDTKELKSRRANFGHENAALTHDIVGVSTMRPRGVSPPSSLLGLFALNSLCTAAVLQLTADSFDDELRASPCAPCLT